MHIKFNRNQYEKLLETHFQPHLSKKSYNQFMKALRSPVDRFWTGFIRPDLLLNCDGEPVQMGGTISADDADLLSDLEQVDWSGAAPVERPAYICLSHSKFLTGRNQLPTLQYLGHADWRTGEVKDPRSEISFFTNAMRFGAAIGSTWDAPSDRVVLGPVTVFTLEIDPPSDWSRGQKVNLLEEQMAWFRRKGNSAKSAPIYSVIEWLNQFSDFRGLCANYSGNKSIHFHFVFNTTEVMSDNQDLRDQFRPAYQLAWYRLSEKFAELLPVYAEHDTALQQPEQFRRLPNGVNVVEKDKHHLFDVPAGSAVPQLTLFEHLTRQAPKNAEQYFVEPLEIKRAAGFGKSKRAPKHSMSLDDWACNEERLYCFEQLQALVSKRLNGHEYPKLADLEFNGCIKAKFLANEHDKTPNILLFEDQQLAISCGGKRPERELRLLQPLGRYIDQWRKQWRRTNDYEISDISAQTSRPDEPTELGTAHPRPYTIEEAREQFSDYLESKLTKSDVLFVKGAEGLGKTTAAMRLLPKLAEQIRAQKSSWFDEFSTDYRARNSHRTLSAVATASYEQAIEKCEQFKSMHGDDQSIAGIVFRSFDYLYCSALKSHFGDDWETSKFDAMKAAQHGHSSVLSAIQREQPVIWKEMQVAHEQMLEPLNNVTHGVLFMVHDVLHQWSEGGLTRQLLHPDFFETPTDEMWMLIDQTELTIAIHDEISVPHFVRIEPACKINWCEELFSTYKVWDDKYPNLATALASFQSHVSEQMGDVSFSDVLEIHRNRMTTDDPIGVGPIEKYGFDKGTGRSWPMYEDRHKLRFACQKRDWLNGLAAKTIILTTEDLPTEIFRAASANHDKHQILDVSDLCQPAGQVLMHRFPSIKSADNTDLAYEMRDQLGRPDLHVICNNANDLENHSTYIGAKGRNDLADRDIMQIMNFVAPSSGALLHKSSPVGFTV